MEKTLQILNALEHAGMPARRLSGMGSHLAPGRDLAAELDEEREHEDLERMRNLGG